MSQTSDERLENQIYEVLGPQPVNPNQPPWLRNGSPARERAEVGSRVERERAGGGRGTRSRAE
eukprot:3699132-Rhodomonas_salina.1